MILVWFERSRGDQIDSGKNFQLEKISVRNYDSRTTLRKNLELITAGPWIPGSVMKKLTFHEWNQILVSYRFESVQLFSDNLELRVALYSEFFISERFSVFKMSTDSRVPPSGGALTICSST